MALRFRLDEILAVKVFCMRETEATWLFSGKVSVRFRFNSSIVFLIPTHVSFPLASHTFLSLAFHPLLFHSLPVTALTQRAVTLGYPKEAVTSSFPS